MSPPHPARRAGILMVVSPGEEELAADALGRALAAAPPGAAAWLVRNGVPDRAWEPVAAAVRNCTTTVIEQAKRPYFAIGRTVFGALGIVARSAAPPELIAKIDPDTAVASSRFFDDLFALETEHPADLYLCAVPVPRGLALVARLAADLLPAGPGRRELPGNRYGSPRSLRTRPAWHARTTLRSLLRPGAPWRPASGGFYALTRRALSRLDAARALDPRGPDGLEWNDDTLLPAAVAGLGGRIVDLRATRFADGWRWMHGSRYFSAGDAAAPDLRALHPLKQNDNDWKTRRSIPFPGAPRPQPDPQDPAPAGGPAAP